MIDIVTYKLPGASLGGQAHGMGTSMVGAPREAQMSQIHFQINTGNVFIPSFLGWPSIAQSPNQACRQELAGI